MTLTMLAAAVLPVVNQVSMVLAAQGPSIGSKIVGWAAGAGGAVLAVFLIIGIVKDGIAYAKGGGSVLPIIGKVLFLLLCIGLIYFAVSYATTGEIFKGLAGKVVNEVNKEANTLLK
jgi:hypothetical protein